MKKLVSFILCLTLAVTITGCGKKPDYSTPDSIPVNLDDDQYYLGSSITRRIAEGPEAFYFMSGSYLYYMDKETLETAPLCTKPDCKHYLETDYEKGIACGAYHHFPMYITYHNEKLYVTGWPRNPGGINIPTVLNRYNLQGEFEKEVTVLPSSVGSVIQHRGTLYYVYYGIDEDENDNDWGDVYFVSYDLETGEEKTIATWPGTEVYSAGDTFASGDYVYTRVSYFLDPEEFVTSSRYAIYNTKTGKLSYLYPHEDTASMCAAYIYGDKLIYTEYKENEDGSKDHEHTTTVCMAEMDGTNPEQVSKIKYEDGIYCVFDDIMLVSNINEVYMNKGYTEKFAIYKDMEFIGEFDLSSIKWKNGGNASQFQVLAYSDVGEYIVFTTMSQTTDEYALIGVKKADLEKGQAKPWLIIESQRRSC